MKYAIIYIGAPYGDNESGHIVSRHKSLKTASKKWWKEIEGTTGQYNHLIVELDESGKYDRFSPMIPIGQQ